MRRADRKSLKTFATVAHADRLAILRFLNGGERSVGDIVRELRLEQSAVSHHLRHLADCGLVRVRKEGSFRFYSSVPHRAKQVLKLSEDLSEIAATATKELGKAKEKFDLVVNMSPIGIMVIRQGRCVFMNPAGFKMLGYGRQEQVIGHRLIDYALPGRKALAVKLWQRMRVGKHMEWARYQARLHDGRVIWLETEARPLSGRGEEGVLAIFRDVTGRLKAEETLRQSEEKFRKVFNDGPLGIVLADLDYRYINVNPKFCRMLGYTEAEIKRLGWVRLTHPDHVAADRRGLAAVLGGRISAYHTEKRYLTRSGGVIWADATASLVRDDAGRPLFYQTMIEDITVRKAAEESLRQSEERYRQIFESGQLGMVLTGKDLRFVRVNDKFCQMLGYSESELVGQTFASITHPAHRAADVRGAKRVLAGRSAVYRTEKRYLTKSGRVIWVDMTASLVRDDAGQPLFFLTTFEDITDRKATEEALRRNGQRLSSIVYEGPTLVFTVDCDGKILSVGDTGHWPDQKDLVGKTILDVMPLEHRRSVRRVFENACFKGRPGVVKGVGKDGRQCVCHIAPVFRPGDGKPEAIVTMIIA